MDNKTKEELIKKGALKPLSEPFKEYPYVAEKTIQYGNYKEKDIVFIKEYKYSDGTIGRDHLFVIIDDNNTSVPLEYFSFLISSNLKNKINIEKNSNYEKIYILPSTNEIYILGTVTDINFQLYKNLS